MQTTRKCGVNAHVAADPLGLLEMAENTPSEGTRDRLAAKGEEALGKLAQDLLENPLINGALTAALQARERAAAAQEVAMGALNIPSAADIERLTRRVRSVSQRLEGIEDVLDRLEQALGRARNVQELEQGYNERLGAIDQRLTELTKQLEKLSPGKGSPST